MDLSLSTRENCDALKKHQEYFWVVKVFHQVALAGFQIVPIHLAVALDWARSIKTILRPDFCSCSTRGPLNQYNGSAAVSRGGQGAQERNVQMRLGPVISGSSTS